MELAFQIPNKLYYIKNFLDYKTYKKIHSEVFKDKLIDLKTTENEWEDNLSYGYKNFTKRTQFNDDGGYDYGVTYYLNRRWGLKFGGELLYIDNKSYGFIPIIPNSLLILKTPILHKVSLINKPLIARKTIQIFIKK